MRTCIICGRCVPVRPGTFMISASHVCESIFGKPEPRASVRIIGPDREDTRQAVALIKVDWAEHLEV